MAASSPHETKVKTDILIIGSGISSLICGALLSKKGKSVTVVEQHVKPGGYLHCFKRFGLQFDTGAHYVGLMEPGETFHTLLSYLNAFDSEQFIRLDPEGFDQFNYPDFSFDFPKGYDALTTQLSSLFPNEKNAIESYFQSIQETVTQFPTYALKEEVDETVIQKTMEVNLGSVVESQFHNPRLKALLYAHTMIHGVAPWDMSFGLHSLVFDSMVKSPFGFKKGGDPLADILVKAIEKNGGKVITRCQIEKLLTSGKTITGALTKKGEVLEADQYISGAHPKVTYGWIDPEALSPALKFRLNRLKESTAIFGVYGYAEKEPSLHPLKNYYFLETLDAKELFRDRTPDDPTAVIFATRPDRGQNTSSRYPVTLHAPGPIKWFQDFEGSRLLKRPEAYLQLKGKMTGKIFQLLDSFQPDLSPQIKDFETSSALTNLHFNGSPEGSGYGIYHSVENTGMRAFGPRTHFNNLFLTGQSTLCPGILGAAISGLRTAGHLIGIKPLIRELNLHRGLGGIP